MQSSEYRSDVVSSPRSSDDTSESVLYMLKSVEISTGHARQHVVAIVRSRCNSDVCIWCGYDVLVLYVLDVVIRCQCCIYLMWLCNAIVLYVFDVVMMSSYCMYLIWLWCHSDVCIWCGYDVLVLYVLDLVIRCQCCIYLMWLWCGNSVCVWCDFAMSQCCLYLMFLWCHSAVCLMW